MSEWRKEEEIMMRKRGRKGDRVREKLEEEREREQRGGKRRERVGGEISSAGEEETEGER